MARRVRKASSCCAIAAARPAKFRFPIPVYRGDATLRAA
jgi:hypothetical protein